MTPAWMPAAPASLGSTAAALAVVLLGGVALFQLALALGAPWGRFAWGGRASGVLPPRLRVGSAAAVPVLIGMATVVAVAGGLVRPDLRDRVGAVPWVLVGFLALNTLGNFASRSAGERWVFGPVTAGLTLLVAVVAAGAGPPPLPPAPPADPAPVPAPPPAAAPPPPPPAPVPPTATGTDGAFDAACAAAGGRVVTESTWAHLDRRHPDAVRPPFRRCDLPSATDGKVCTGRAACGAGQCWCLGDLARPDAVNDPALAPLDGLPAVGRCENTPVASGVWWCTVEDGRVHLRGMIVD